MLDNVRLVVRDDSASLLDSTNSSHAAHDDDDERLVDKGPTIMAIRRRSLSRLAFLFAIVFVVRLVFFPTSQSSSSKTKGDKNYQIKEHNFIERATRPDRSLNVQKHPFLQARMGRDEGEELFAELIANGAEDYWERFQMPYIENKETSNMDAQHVLGAVDQLLSLNGWVGHLCPTLTRPFGQNKRENAYDELIREDHFYYVAIVIHSADHFLVDQLAVIVQMVKRLGTHNMFVSMLDYDSTDSTETLVDLCEAVLTLLGVPFRIRRVGSMTEDPAAAYYPLEEAYMRNLALEPLHDLLQKRNIKFSRVVWLKGFTCPNDILETIKISFDNEAAMVCGMDWAEHNGFFMFSDRWRTRDIEGDQFRQSKSSSKSSSDSVPPRDKQGAERYIQHLPFQVFCCESGTHVVDPSQSYYRGISYRAGKDFHNGSNVENVPVRDPDAPCLDSSQAYFCRDLWVGSALVGVSEVDKVNDNGGLGRRSWGSWWGRKEVEVREVASFDRLMERRDAAEAAAVLPVAGVEETDAEKIVVGDAANPAVDPAPDPAAAAVKGRDNVKIQVGAEEEEVNDAAADTRKKNVQKGDPDANAGSDYDAIPVEEGGDDVLPPEVGKLSIPNSVYRPARILVNPRCPTTYAGVSHTKLARDLFGEPGDDVRPEEEGSFVLEDWEGAPESFVCQEQRQTGGRKAAKTQRRIGFSIHDELQALSKAISQTSLRN